MPTTTISIDPAFQALCPRQTDDELALLRASLKEEGCRDPIVYWRAEGNPILDGMTRFEICLDEEIAFDTRGMEFATRREAECWLLRNQLGRRNLSDAQRDILRGGLYNTMKGDPAENLKKGSVSRSIIIDTSGNVADELAAEYGVSPLTIKRDGKLAEAVEKLTPVTQTQIAGTKVADSKAELKRLADLPVKNQEAVAKVIGSGKAKTVAEAVKLVEKRSKNPVDKTPFDEPEVRPLVDALKRPVPDRLRQVFELVPEFKRLRRELGEILKQAKALESGPAGKWLEIIQLRTDIENARHALKFGTPYIVCRYCGGSGCQRCRQGGYLNETPTTRKAEE